MTDRTEEERAAAEICGCEHCASPEYHPEPPEDCCARDIVAYGKAQRQVERERLGDLYAAWHEHGGSEDDFHDALYGRTFWRCPACSRLEHSSPEALRCPLSDRPLPRRAYAPKQSESEE